MRRRFWIGAILTLPLVAIAMRYVFFPEGLLDRLAAFEQHRGELSFLLSTETNAAICYSYDTGLRCHTRF